MADPRAFISFDFDNNAPQRLYFCGQIKNSRTPFNVEDWSSKKELEEHEWEELLEAKIKKCNMLIVLVGKNMSTAKGVAKEITFAKKHNVPVFGVYVDNADEKNALPEGLQRNRTIYWVWNDIADAIDQVMKEGKNK